MVTKLEELVSWQQVEEYLDKLCAHILVNNIPHKGVYGIPRGGLVLAVMLSHKLDIPLLLAPTKDCIIVDDIADSGRSLLHYTNNDTQFNNYFITTMYYDKRSMVKPNYYSKEKQGKWIVFPWEVKYEESFTDKQGQ